MLNFEDILKEKGRVTFKDCIIELFFFDDFVKEYDRLNNSNLTKIKQKWKNRDNLTRMIDEATGYNPFEHDDNFKKDFEEFIKFVDNYIWQPVCNEIGEKNSE